MIHGIVLGLWLSSCRKDVSSPFTEGVTTRAPSPRPIWDSDAIPIGRLHYWLCEGERRSPERASQMRERVASQLAEGTYAHDPLLGFSCPMPSFCAWAAARAESSGSDSAWWSTLSGCQGEPYDTLVDRQAPAGVLLSRAMDRRVVTPRVREVSLEQLREAAGKPEFEGAAWYALSALGSAADTEAGEAALVDAYTIVGPALQPVIVSYLRGARSVTGKKLFREMCQQSGELSCEQATIDPLTDITSAIGSGLDPEELHKSYANHGTAVTQALLRCASELDPENARRCVLALARFDRASAARGALALPPEDSADLRRVLVLSPEAVQAALAEMSLPAPPSGSDAVTIPEILLASDRALRLSDLLGIGPLGDTDHVRLLYALAALGGLDTPDAQPQDEWVFDQQVPSPRALEIEGRMLQITLLAWHGGWRWRGLVQEGGPHAAVHLVNALLASADRPLRLAISDGIVIAGTPEQLDALAQGEWVRFEAGAASALAPPVDPEWE